MGLCAELLLLARLARSTSVLLLLAVLLRSAVLSRLLTRVLTGRSTELTLLTILLLARSAGLLAIRLLAGSSILSLLLAILLLTRLLTRSAVLLLSVLSRGLSWSAWLARRGTVRQYVRKHKPCASAQVVDAQAAYKLYVRRTSHIGDLPARNRRRTTGTELSLLLRLTILSLRGLAVLLLRGCAVLSLLLRRSAVLSLGRCAAHGSAVSAGTTGSTAWCATGSRLCCC